MNTSLKLTQFGESVGLVVPDEVLARLSLAAGDTLVLTEAADGFRLTVQDASLASQLKLGREFMDEYSETFHALAK